MKVIEHEGKTYHVRTGKLFEVGEYKDKGIDSVTTEDLDRLVANFNPIELTFSKGASINLEHRKTPLDGHLGKVARVWRDGNDLMGDCIVPPFISSVLDETGDKGLSIEVDPKLTNISGLALTMSPRVAAAALFSDDEVMSKLFPKEEKMADEKTVTMSVEELDKLKAQAAQAETVAKELEIKLSKVAAEQRSDKAEAKFAELLAAGKVVPAQKEAAIALMSMEGSEVIKFSGKELSVNDIVKSLLENAPVGVDFSTKGLDTDPNKAQLKFNTLQEFTDAEPNDKFAVVSDYMKANKISNFAEADTKLRAELGGK